MRLGSRLRLRERPQVRALGFGGQAEMTAPPTSFDYALATLADCPSRNRYRNRIRIRIVLVFVISLRWLTRLWREHLSPGACPGLQGRARL
jgi:hypothetical protein